MKIQIGDTSYGFFLGSKQEYENPNTEIEENILKDYAKNFDGQFKVEHKSSNYSTLVNEYGDVIRLKYGNKSKWIKIPITNREKYINSPLFINQKNKNELFWKSTITTQEDLDKYIDIIKEELEKLK